MPFWRRKKDSKNLESSDKLDEENNLRKTLEELSNLKLKDCPKFRIEGNFLAQVVKVYDGDTITIAMGDSERAQNRYYEHSVRMYGYDSPEIRPPKSKKYAKGGRFSCREDEVAAGKLAKEYLSELILGQPVRVEVIPDDDKYGRLLCKVYSYPKMEEWLENTGTEPPTLEDFDLYVNGDMLENNYGYEYFGGTKET